MNPPVRLPRPSVFCNLLHKAKRHGFHLVLGLVWTAAVLYGLVLLWEFNLKAGPEVATEARWPVGSELAGPEGNPKLVVFLHPQCPCSRATVDELAVVLARVDRKLDVDAVFVSGSGDRIEESGLWNQVRALPGVQARVDVNDREAGLFSAATSGDAFLYDGKGVLKYRGGLTPARGHQGDSFGVDAVVGIVNEGGGEKLVTGPVYGCALSSVESPAKP